MKRKAKAPAPTAHPGPSPSPVWILCLLLGGYATCGLRRPEELGPPPWLAERGIVLDPVYLLMVAVTVTLGGLVGGLLYLRLLSFVSKHPDEAFERFTGPIHALAAATGPETLVAQRPSLSHSVVPHASHWPMLDSPQWFHTELVHFLGRCKHEH